jgi:hypothetical protein
MALIATIGSFLPSLFGKEIKLKTAKLLGWIVLALLLVALLSVGKCAYDKSVIEHHEEVREAKAGKAREVAADRRVDDQINNAKSEEELHNVIEAAPGGTLSPAAKSLACERLRRQGRIPPACGTQSRDRTQAGS